MKTIIIHINQPGAISRYMRLKARGWRTLWTGNYQICLTKP